MGDKPKLVACSPGDVLRALRKLGGFSIKESAKHIKITHMSGYASTIPRHSPVKRNLLRDFVEDYLVLRCGLTTTDIYAYLWC